MALKGLEISVAVRPEEALLLLMHAPLVDECYICPSKLMGAAKMP